MQRIRIYYAKTQALRYTGNLDVHKIWERTLRRAKLPLAYSQGFHPQPKLNQACPLPLGMLSRAEIIDIWLEPDLPLEQVEERLASHTQPGIEIDHFENIDLHEPALQTRVAASRYQVTLLTLPGESQISQPELSEKVAGLLSAESLPRQRRDKPYDLRPFIQQLEIIAPDEKGQPVLSMLLSATAGASGRPEEVLSAMGFDPFSTRIERVELVFLS
jgi:radical SAM-linked protein